MTNRVAFGVAVVIVAAILLDITANHGLALTFLLRKLVDAVDYLAFWR
jgi:hypothetical protein